MGFSNIKINQNETGEVNWKRFKSFKHISRVYAKVYNVIEIWKSYKNKVKGENNLLTAVHFRKAKLYLIRQMQSECYEKELKILQQGKPVNYGNCRSFRLHLDDYGIIRCRGRFEYSPTMKELNFPILYGNKHILTDLMLWHIHQKENCPGYSYTLHRIKKEMYFPKFKTKLNKIFNSCAKCLIHKARAFIYPGNPPLPEFRTEARTPFEYSGLDYAGPFLIRSHDFDGKVWICLFTCLVTRACHLTIVPDNTSDAFLKALSELQTFYRLPKLLLSDNATQFHAADRILVDLRQNKVIQAELGEKGITWHFTPARASHIGGVFERMIGLLKIELRKISGGIKLTYQELKGAPK